jgi:hypothetical protein
VAADRSEVAIGGTCTPFRRALLDFTATETEGGFQKVYVIRVLVAESRGARGVGLSADGEEKTVLLIKLSCVDVMF